MSDSETPKKFDYSATLNLPTPDVKNGGGDGIDTNLTAIPLRAGLPLREPNMLTHWESIDLYGQTLKASKPKGDFILHDGPPYSNGNIHLGHALNKILKDIIVKSKSMAGFRAPYVPGWDNHGLPIETAVTKEFREKKLTPSPLELRKRCREYALEWVNKQREQFKRLGINGDWDNPYLTLGASFEADIVGAFKELVRKGFIYRGLKPVHWCTTDRTALADAEIEYADRDDQSIFVAFKLESDANSVLPKSDLPTYAVIWTTTPWTIPANLALAVHPDHTYALVEVSGARYLVGQERIEALASIAGWESHNLVYGFAKPGRDLVGMEFRHPLYQRNSPVVTASYVTFEDGTGIVHTAPGHGREDFETGQRNGLEVLSPVDDGGKFTAEAGPQFEGQSIWDGNKSVIEALKTVGALIAQQTIHHSYPHCWRCHNPVIFRATRQWFMSIDHDGHRERCLEQINNVSWFPPESKARISAMVGGRPDWCLSRQRIWGVGIPVFYCKGCENELLDVDVIDHVESKIRAANSDIWFDADASDLLPYGYACTKCGSKDFGKESDIFDVWFDSGTTNLAVLASGRWPDLRWPADVYLEGGDQHRGWFNSSLMVAVGVKGEAPYKQVITNGWTLDEHGKKFSKSLGNGVAPEDVISKFGADALRLWVASTDYFQDVRVGKGILDQTVDMYRRLRNTLRYGLTNLYDFDPVADSIACSDLNEIDRYMLHRLAEVSRDCQVAYERYEFHKVTALLHQFASVDLSAFYFDVLKDTLYNEAADSKKRRSAQTSVHIITLNMATLLAPILSFTSDEVWDKLRIDGNKPVSAQLAGFADLSDYLDSELANNWKTVLAFREEAYREIEQARQTKLIGKPLEAKVTANRNSDFTKLHNYEQELAEILLVSEVELKSAASSQKIEVTPASGVKCARCWLIKRDVNEDTMLCGRCTTVVNSTN